MSHATGGTADTVPILILDDDVTLRRAVCRQLERRGYAVLEAGTVPEAKEILDGLEGALVLCDIDLPGESGLVLVQDLRSRQPDIAIVMVTAVDDPEVASAAVQRGAYGYVVKPFEANELVISVLNAVRRRELEIASRRHEADLEALVAERTAELKNAFIRLSAAHEETVRRLAWAAEYRDPETGNHLERMSRYAAVLAKQAGLPGEQVDMIQKAAPMHDIGKVGIRDAVLCKPGRFDDIDREVMSHHPEIGHRILAGSASDLLQLAAMVALTHHEKWDGSGYPYGLVGDEIPLPGRIVAIADVFDALSSRRRYKEPMDVDAAFAMLLDDAGKHFDPDLVDCFIAAREAILDIRDRFSDDPEAADELVVS